MIDRAGDALVTEMGKAGVFGFEVSPVVPPVSLLSLPMGVFAAIQERTGLGFLAVLDGPLNDLSVADELIQACRVKAGFPEREEVTMEQAVRMLVRLPSDLPEPIQVDGDGSLDPTFATATPGS